MKIERAITLWQYWTQLNTKNYGIIDKSLCEAGEECHGIQLRFLSSCM